MKKVLNVLILMSLAFVLTQDIIEVIAFLMFLFMSVLIVRHIQRYLYDRRFRKDCDELFTEEFYVRLNTVIKNEFK